MELSNSANSVSLDNSKFAKLSSVDLSVQSLTEKQVIEMWLLFESYYDDVTYDKFLNDLYDKSRVILLLDRQKRIQGFSTIKSFYIEVDGQRARVIFSGDTIIAQAYWGQTALQKRFYLYLFKEFIKHPFIPVYWYLISKGYKTYLLLSRNFNAYWPCHFQDMPSNIKNIIAYLSERMFADAWRAETGTLEFSEQAGKLKQAVAPVTSELRRFPDIDFFVKTNPKHSVGNELCCLGLVNASLVWGYPFKLVKKLVRRLRKT